MFPEDKTNISEKFEILMNFIALLKTLPDIDSNEDFLKILVIPIGDSPDANPTLEKLEEVKKRVLKRDQTAEAILEKLRSCFANMRGSWPKQKPSAPEYELNQVVIKQLNLLITTTEDYLDYLQTHIKYQSRCAKYTSDVNVLIRNEVVNLKKVSTETLAAIFSLIDDFIDHDRAKWSEFEEIYNQVENKDLPLTPEIITKLAALIEEKNNFYMVQRFSLFDLEKRGIIKNFSFEQQSKFFDM